MTLNETKAKVRGHMDKAYAELKLASDLIDEYRDNGGQLDRDLKELERDVFMAMVEL
ncbi:hypothetical protein [Veillonella criceti]|uniref:Uncharacterized protein n=1 Tax=Veillonella criceti TaxID=103891 RepID=A0A380NJP5_9FIRM|nr:hypothetical protein [Veillonella criceti]SUP42292.1 Uncharacterised protein [Veillonella criceti]